MSLVNGDGSSDDMDMPEMPAMPSFSAGGGGGGGYSGGGNINPGAAAAQGYQGAIAGAQRELSRNIAQKPQTLADLQTWYAQAGETQDANTATNASTMAAAIANQQDATMGVTGLLAGLDPSAAADVGIWGGLSTGAMNAQAASQGSFDADMTAALQSQLTDSMRIEGINADNMISNAQQGLYGLQSDAAGAAAQANTDWAMQQAQMSFQAGENAADRSLQAQGMAADAANSAWSHQMDMLGLKASEKQDMINNLLNIAEYKKANGGGEMTFADVMSAIPALQNMDLLGLQSGMDITAAADAHTAAGDAHTASQQNITTQNINNQMTLAQIQSQGYADANTQASTASILAAIARDDKAATKKDPKAPFPRAELFTALQQSIGDKNTGKPFQGMGLPRAINLLGDSLRAMGYKGKKLAKARSVQRAVLYSVFGHARVDQWVRHSPKQAKNLGFTKKPPAQPRKPKKTTKKPKKNKRPPGAGRGGAW